MSTRVVGSHITQTTVGDGTNRQCINDEIAMPEFNAYRDRWERLVNFKNHSDYRSKRHCVKDPLDYPDKSPNAYVRTTPESLAFERHGHVLPRGKIHSSSFACERFE